MFVVGDVWETSNAHMTIVPKCNEWHQEQFIVAKLF